MSESAENARKIRESVVYEGDDETISIISKLDKDQKKSARGVRTPKQSISLGYHNFDQCIPKVSRQDSKNDRDVERLAHLYIPY